MTIFYKEPGDRVIIDVTGPSGTAIELLGQAALWMTQMNKPSTEIGGVLIQMQSKDYENMITVFHQHFGEFCDIIR